DLVGAVDADKLQPFEAEQIALGADPEMQSQIYGCYYQENDERDWLTGLRETIAEADSSSELCELLWESQSRQQKYVEDLRSRTFSTGAEHAELLYGAINKLTADQTLSAKQADQVRSWVIGPDNPDAKSAAFARLDEQLSSADDLPDNVKQLFC
ncbi:MAG TPA: hypothetical protein VK983_01070, partial [Candidatus Limnocylindrales bacterium]|nr:hypothetical protein [Candidatus Limnocylindrales bacterium]